MPLTRRAFLKTAAVATAGTAFSARSYARIAGANSAIRVALVGLNIRGRTLVSGFAQIPGVRVAALCDVDSAVLERAVAIAHTAAPHAASPQTFADFRDVLTHADIDAVVIATPNHHHALQAIWALQAGKDVYLEKPVSHTLWESWQIRAAAKQHDRVVQVGTQSRSSVAIDEAVAWTRAGHLGRVTAARVLCYKRRFSIGKTTTPVPPPATVDYDLWLGPAPRAPLRRQRFHYDWHWQWATGNGDIANQGNHQIDVARRFLGDPPLAPRTFTVGGRLGYDDDGDTPNTLVVFHDYAGAPLISEVRGLPAKHDPTEAAPDPALDGIAASAAAAGTMDRYQGVAVGNLIHCEGGTIVVPATNYSSAQALDADGKTVREFTGGVANHFGNFIDAVRSGKHSELRAPLREGHVSSSLAHLANISHRAGRAASPAEIRDAAQTHPLFADACERLFAHLDLNAVDLEKTPLTLGLPLTLDPATERFTGETAAAANAHLTHDYRPPFVVPQLT